MIRIGTTETYDPVHCIDDWIQRYNEFDFVLFITKNITDPFITILTKDPKWKYDIKPSILHITCTGFGGTEFEPGVPNFMKLYSQTKKLIEQGYPVERIVLRIDPFIPLKESFKKFKEVTELFYGLGIRRVRTSILDLYGHVRERFETVSIGKEVLKEYSDFRASDWWFNNLEPFIKGCILNWENIQFEACTEPKLSGSIFNHRGCVSELDLQINDINEQVEQGAQRKFCGCLLKKQLIPGGFNRGRCPHKCLYCYIKDKEVE